MSEGDKEFQEMLDRTFNTPPEIQGRIDAVSARFDKFFDKEFMEFQRIKDKKGSCRVTHAFRMLDILFPSDNASDMIVHIWGEDASLRPTFENVETLTEDQILELVRCGVSFEQENDLLISI